jgi:hypothetical protein
MVNANGVRFTDSIIDVLNECRKFKRLKDNWDGEGALSPDTRSVSFAENFVCLLDESFGVPETMLHTNGRLGLFWNDNGVYADLEFIPDGSIAYYIKNKNNIFKGITAFNGVDIPADLNNIRSSDVINSQWLTNLDIADRVNQALSKSD